MTQSEIYDRCYAAHRADRERFKGNYSNTKVCNQLKREIAMFEAAK